MAEDPRNPFAGPLGRGQQPTGGGAIIRLKGNSKVKQRKADRDLESGIGEAARTSVAKERKYRNTSRGIRNSHVEPIDLMWNRTEAANSNGRGRQHFTRAGDGFGQKQHDNLMRMFLPEGSVAANMKRKGSRNRPYRSNDNYKTGGSF